jgi:acetyl esterase
MDSFAIQGVDPELAVVAERIPRNDISDPFAARGRFEAMLAAVRANSGTLTDSRVKIVESRVPGPPGAPDVAVRVYQPEGLPGPRPGFLMCHGGGFILGNLDSEHPKCLSLVVEAGFVVVSVDWRRAPENPFPAGVDDCYAVLGWTADHADELQIDRTKIGVGGSSSGGCFAAAVALMTRDRGGPRLAFQWLVYPALDDRCETVSARSRPDGPGWTSANCVAMWQHYLGPDPSDVSPYAAPARADDLTGLPPTYLLVAELDPLRDEGLDYAARLLRAGVSVELQCYPGAFHGFEMLAPEAAVSRRAYAEQIAAAGRLGAGVVQANRSATR